MIRRLVMYAALAGGLATACTSGGDSALLRKASAQQGDGPVDEDEPERATLTASKLQPVLAELGAEGVVPSAIVVSFATPIVDRDEVGRITSKSVLKISPEVLGTLTYASNSELRFTPSEPLAHDTKYTLELQQVETRDGVLEPPAGAKWTHSFQTPAFRLLGWAPTEIDLARKAVKMELTFSGAVLANVARGAMTFTLDGAPIGTDVWAGARSGVTVLGGRGASPHLVTVQISDPRLAAGSKLGLALRGDLMSIAGGRAPATELAYTVTGDRVVSIKGAKFVEGANGYFLEVACDDKAAPTGSRYYYDAGESHYGMSQRCQLADDAIAKIRFHPPVEKTYISGGKNGFRVFGQFQRGVYQVRIDGGATTVDGGVVTAPFSRSYSVAARKPQLAFGSTGRYLPRKAWSNLGIKHLNVEEANLVVRQVPPENLVFWLGDTTSDAADDRTSNVILKQRLPLRGSPDTPEATWQDVSSLLPASTKGVLELKLAGVGVSATSRLLLTNLSLVAKKTQVPDKPWLQTVHVWALDTLSSELLDGVAVELVRKSGKVVASCKTANGGCVLEVTDTRDPDRAEPFALIARKGDDLTYLRYQDLRAAFAESNTTGTPYAATTPYRAAMYADRGVYRPGETAHVVAVVRDAKDRAPDQPLPVDVQVIDPRAKVVRKQALKTNAAGVLAIDHALPPFADTGRWTVQLAVAGKPLASYGVQVEEFVPERMAVTIVPRTPELLAGAKAEFDVAARYLFGGTAIDSGVQLDCSVAPAAFEPAHNSEYVYGSPPRGKPVTLAQVKQQLDPAGKVKVACGDAPGDAAFTQTAQLTATASVLEAGSGRATVKSTTATLHPEKFYIGLKTKTPVVTSGRAFTVEGMLVDWEGKPVDGAVTSLDIELAHLEADYGYGYDEHTGEATYSRNMRHVPEGKRQVPVASGRFSFEVTPGQADIGYIVIAKAGKARTELLLDGLYPYEYYSEYFENDRVDHTPRPAKPTRLKLQLPDKTRVGEPATVKILAPYRGRVLWTVETDRVVASHWADTQGGEASWTFTLSEFAPNVYVSALVIKDPHLESKTAFLPDRAFGVASTRVEPVHATHDVTLTVAGEVRSASPLAVTIDLGPSREPTFATIAVVDEGILSLTGFRTPDPTSQLFARRALGVETYETIGWTMLHQPAGTSSKTGGGDDPEAEEDVGGDGGDRSRVQPVKPVALFSGVVEVPADGKLTVPFQLPTYRGQLRVMVVTASPSKVGRAEAKVTVKDPLVLQVTFPRFLTHEDEIQIPVFLTNLSGGKLDVTVRLESSHLPVPGVIARKDAGPAITFAGKDTGTIAIADKQAQTIVFQAKAAIPSGAAKLRVVARAGTLEVSDELEVPFLPAGPRERVIQKLRLEPGKLDLAAKATALRGWMPASETTTFWVTANPYGESFEHLRYLIRYPYGCIEQTTSTVRPLLYVAALAEQVEPRLAELRIEDMVLSGIQRIFAMQTPAGGFGYWPGATEPEDWSTAYATHFLLDAKKAGYAIPDDRLRDVLAWIDRRAAAFERGLGNYARRGPHYDGQVQAYFHYVLALAGKGKKARILKLVSDMPARRSGQQEEDLYLLKAALQLAGDRRYEKDLKTVDASPIGASRDNSWSFYSDRRRRGLMLATFFDLFGNDPAGEPLAQRVAQALVGQPSYWYTTQELVWGVTGLGKWVAAQSTKGVAGGTLVADGQTIAPRATKQTSNDRTWTLHRAGDYKGLALDVPASAAGMWLVIHSEGVRPGKRYPVGGNGLAVTRTYRSLDGTELDPAAGELALGDLAYVEVELANTSGVTIQNIALVDRLPAGFEIENPRLGRTVRLDWVEPDELWHVDFQNMRDDRIEAFGALAPRARKKIVYTVRAVTSGRFTIPPVEAEAMYDPSLWARAAGGTAVVGGPWTGKTI
jgi:alpha-2-macroglobulin